MSSIVGTELRALRQQLGLSQAKLAELSVVSQHLISAFELEKTSLPASLLNTVAEALADKPRVTKIAERGKRYQRHRYANMQHSSERVAKAARTPGNAEYTALLEDLYARHRAPKTSQLSAVSLFSGCGGFSLGFSAAGFVVRAFLELDDSLRAIYKRNFPDSLQIGTDITKLTEVELERAAIALKGTDVILGGPPCQGFSLSGKRQVNDPRNTLFKHYLRLVDRLQPKFAVLENVRLLTSMKNPSGGFVRDDICGAFRDHGYRTSIYEVNAKDYGVPQHRERVLFIAVRADLGVEPGLPEQTHSEIQTMFSKTCP
jgi:DNA (cytosine-5)-methyltransferase 1